jgi:hypothetical protein
VSDVKDAYDGLPNASWYCVKGFAGAHTFPFQSRDELLRDLVRVVTGRGAPVACELPTVRGQ